jgi:hypothetical protein
MTRHVYKYEIPIDGQPHNYKLNGIIRRVESSEILYPGPKYGSKFIVEFWTEQSADQLDTEHTFQVFDTGRPLPDNATWIGTTNGNNLGHAFHLYELKE